MFDLGMIIILQIQTNRRILHMLNSNTLLSDRSCIMLRSINQAKNLPQKWKQKKLINLKKCDLKGMNMSNSDLSICHEKAQRFRNIQNRCLPMGEADDFQGAVMIFTNTKMEKIVMKINLNQSADVLKIKKVNTFINYSKKSIRSRASARLEDQSDSTGISANLSMSETIRMRKKTTNKVSIFFQQSHRGIQSKQLKGSASDKQSSDKQGKQRTHIFGNRLTQSQREEQNINMSNQQKSIKTLIFTIEEGNGAEFIQIAFRKRWWWKSKKDKNDEVKFEWTQLRKNDFFYQKEQISQQLFQINRNSQFGCKENMNYDNFDIVKIHNHLKNIKYLTNKLCLYQISINQEKNHLNIPKKYYIQSFSSKQWLRFTEQNSIILSQSKNILLNYLKQANNYWIIKNVFPEPSNIILQIFNSYDQIRQFLSANLCKGPIMIQQYISDPFLYKNRKFDIKAYVLLVKINHNFRAYVYNEGVVSICSQIYDKMNRDPFIHFAKQSIQINSQKFGQIQPSNMISFNQFSHYLQQNTHQDTSFIDNIFPQMTNLATHVIQKTAGRLASQIESSFQLLEFNYVLDKNLKPWLIDINANPCMQVFNQTTEKIFTKLIDHTFQLTLDVIYPSPSFCLKSKLNSSSRSQAQHNFKQIKMGDLSTLQKFTFNYEQKINDPIAKYDNNSQQQQMALMYFFPEKMKSLSRKSINFSY